MTVWSLIHISDNWRDHHKMSFHFYSCHALTTSVSMVLQKSWNILESILHIYCQTSQKSYVLHWLVETLQLNTISVPLLYYWKNISINTLYYSLVLLYTRCIQSFYYSTGLVLLKSSTLTCQTFHHIGFFPCRHPSMVINIWWCCYDC